MKASLALLLPSIKYKRIKLMDIYESRYTDSFFDNDINS